MALSNAEKQARWRAKRAAEVEALRKAAGQQQPHAKATAAPSAELAEARREIERLRSENAALKTQAQDARQQGFQDAMTAFHGARAAQEAEAEARKGKRAAAHEAAKKAAANLSADAEKTLIEKLEHAERLLKARTTEVKNLKQKLHWTPPPMTKRLHRQVLGLLHPDRAHNDEAMRKRLERCFQEFSAIEFKPVE
jgi:hypothetical protein